MTSIGTLFAFVVVCTSVLVLRLKRPDAHRPFRVPGGPIVPILGIVSCAYLMLSLPVITWVRFLGWLNIGFVIYWFYGRTHSPLTNDTSPLRTDEVDVPNDRDDDGQDPDHHRDDHRDRHRDRDRRQRSRI